MKNCELNVRTIDEGAIDEKTGMNFSEYIAILSGDTTLLEKSKLEKKIAVLESLRNAHHKEVIRSRFQLENLQADKAKTAAIAEKLSIDQQAYKAVLRFDTDGTKSNPIHLEGVKPSDPDVIGRHLIALAADWKPELNKPYYKQIGELYGFALFIRQQKEAYEDKGLFEYRHINVFYAESEQTGIKYTWNGGHVNIDNPKMAARYFLNSVDRVDALKEKYQKESQEIEKNIPVLEQLVAKSFEKEKELGQLKNDVARLEREITITLEKRHLSVTPNRAIEKKETNSLLPKKTDFSGRLKSLRN